MRNKEVIIHKDEKSVLEYQNKKNITEEPCMIKIEPLTNIPYPIKAPINIFPNNNGSQTGIKYLKEGQIPNRAFTDQALIIAPNSFTTQLETYKKYFSASSEKVSCSLSYHNDVREYLSVYAHPTVSQIKLFAVIPKLICKDRQNYLGTFKKGFTSLKFT